MAADTRVEASLLAIDSRAVSYIDAFLAAGDDGATAAAAMIELSRR